MTRINTDPYGNQSTWALLTEHKCDRDKCCHHKECVDSNDTKSKRVDSDKKDKQTTEAGIWHLIKYGASILRVRSH